MDKIEIAVADLCNDTPKLASRKYLWIPTIGVLCFTMVCFSSPNRLIGICMFLFGTSLLALYVAMIEYSLRKWEHEAFEKERQKCYGLEQAVEDLCDACDAES